MGCCSRFRVQVEAGLFFQIVEVGQSLLITGLFQEVLQPGREVRLEAHVLRIDFLRYRTECREVPLWIFIAERRVSDHRKAPSQQCGQGA